MTRAQQRWIGVALAIATVIVVTINQAQVGIARDETVYFGAGSRYAEFWLHLPSHANRATIASTFGGELGGGGNPEHPPLMKTLFGLSHVVLHDKLHVFDDVTAYRFPSAVMHGVCVWLVFSLTLEVWGFAEAVLAALALLLLPRALFHAGLAAFDAPAMTLWFATVVAYYRSLDGRAWPWQVGVVFGLALATKHTALLLPFALTVHYLVVGWRAGGARGLLMYRWRVIVSLAVLAPLTLIAVWPLLWHDPLGHVRAWLAFHMTHVHYNFEYLGHNWNAPPFPWHVALVTTLFTVPTATLAAAVLGVSVWCSKLRAASVRAPALLLVLSAAASMGPFFLGSTPIFGAEKHWMPVLPTLCIAAGVGAVWAARRASALLRGHERLAIAIVGTALVVAAATETATAEPYALTWYDALAGGAPGGADHGMNRQFWGVAARGVLPVLATQPPGPVYTHDASPAWGWYHKLGLVPAGYSDAGWEVDGIRRSSLALVIHEKHFNRHDYLIWKSYGTVQPIFVLRSDGVPIVSVYERPR